MIRPATADDVAVVHTMIREMAASQGAAEQVRAEESLGAEHVVVQGGGLTMLRLSGKPLADLGAGG